MRSQIALLLGIVACACACAGGPESTSTDAGWSDAEKCEHVCAAYCGVRERCDGTAHAVCRRALDEADGGTCTQRAGLFSEVAQSQVELCIEAIEAMSCAQFERMFDTGEGVPAECRGIVS